MEVKWIFDLLQAGGAVDHTAIILFILQGIGVLFMLWMKADGSSQRASLKLELKKEQDEKISSVQHEYSIKMEELRNRMENRMTDAVKDQFVRIDVYRSDQDRVYQRFEMMQELMDVQLKNIDAKLDNIVTKLGMGV
jgi:hypothetical protein